MKRLRSHAPFEIVEATLDFLKMSSNVELQEMLWGLKKTDLMQLCMRYRLKSNSNKPELTVLGRKRAMFKQATSWSKTLTGLSDITFIDLYPYLVSSCHKTFYREAFRLLKVYKYLQTILWRSKHTECRVRRQALYTCRFWP